MSERRTIDWYDRHVHEAAARYEALRFEQVHEWLLPLLPAAEGALALDVGAGSGRDAAWLAERGYDVIAVEPSAAMREEARRRHPHPRIRWIDDRLPALSEVSRLGTAFDLILVSAVWMHVAPGDRRRAFRKLVNLLRPGGVIALTLRHGPANSALVMHPTSREEIERLAREHGAFVEHTGDSEDLLARRKVRWEHIALRLPDDGTGALPLLRHVILNDRKSSTYKLALLRVLCRIADGPAGMARDAGESHVSIPMGLVALTWLRLFHPLIRRGFPQAPQLDDGRGLGFVGEGFRRLLQFPAGDLRVGMRWSGADARALHLALKDARETITRQPAFYMTYPDGQPILQPLTQRVAGQPGDVLLDELYLRSFGELRVPRALWQAMQRFSVWVEPAIVAEWRRLTREYAERQGTVLDEAALAEAMTWAEPGRAVETSRERAHELLGLGRQLLCVWSGRRLTPGSLAIDHCLPWAVWPCSDLWNLLPAHAAVNNRKGSRLPDATTLQRAGESIIQWWEEAYQQAPNPVVPQRFVREATATLPTLSPEAPPALEDIFEAVTLRRIRLKHDQQVPEWSA